MLTQESSTPFGTIRSATTLSYLRKVYIFFTLGVVFAIAGAMVALYAGQPVTLVARGGETLTVPPAVQFMLEHGIMGMLLYFGAFFAASFARRIPVVNVGALLGFTFITGLFLAPTLFFVQMRASAGETLDPNPIRDAFLLTGLSFTGLTSYVLISKRDFSFMRGALTMGIWVLLGAMLLSIFFHSAAFSLAISSVGVLLFSGFILYDTWRILQASVDDAVGDALSLYLNVLNLFLSLLRILGAGRQRD